MIEKELIPTIPTEQASNPEQEYAEPEEEQVGDDEITPAQLKALIESNGDELLLLDVRFADEHAQRRIDFERQLLIPLPELENRIEELEPYRDKMIVAYCRSGGRSATATQFLRSRGFNVKNLRGGIVAWQ
ncbi:MAG: rhodanese-like domain-containing protein [Candidatus Kapabacteria bacterium]|nr:rhodanese-like domain-containing protein [Candidatus Kapabacteria bacterium]